MTIVHLDMTRTQEIDRSSLTHCSRTLRFNSRLVKNEMHIYKYIYGHCSFPVHLWIILSLVSHFFFLLSSSSFHSISESEYTFWLNAGEVIIILNEIHCYSCNGIALNGFLHILWIRFFSLFFFSRNLLCILMFKRSFAHFFFVESYSFRLDGFCECFFVSKTNLQWMNSTKEYIQIVLVWGRIIRKIMKDV